MKTPVLSLLCCLLAACFCVGCDEDSDIRFLTNELQGDIIVGQKAVDHADLTTLSTQSFTLDGGTPPYQIAVADPGLLTATLTDGRYLNIHTTGEAGTTTLTATDAKGQTATLTVVIRKQTHRIPVAGIQVKVLDTDGQPADEATTEAITQDVLATSRIQPGNLIYLEPHQRTEEGDEGLLRIYADKAEPTEILYEGTYALGPYLELKTTYLEFDYDGETELYFVRRPSLDYPDIPETREVGPVATYLGRNVTSRYKDRYPGVGQVVMAIFGYSF